MTALVSRTAQSAMDIPGHTWSMMKEQGAMLVRSGFLPESIKTPEQAVTIMLKGRELGIPAMQAFSHIHVIKGKPTISAELMLALIYRECPGAKIEYLRYEADGCTIKATRPGHQPSTFTFNKADAESAQLFGKDNWKKFPRAMYRSRCISEMARSVFADCIMGCSYTPEEINPDVKVDEEGQIINVTPEAAPKPEPETPAAKASTEPRKAGVYEGRTEQQDIIQRILKTREVPEERWDDVHKKLLGKPSTEINRVIAEVMA